MPTLLIRLCGPMQSWGTCSRFTERDTELEPSKSGVVGLLCAALGRPRHEDVSDLAALRMGVRVDHEGTVARDYHTAGGVDGIARASGGVQNNAVLSNRYYLAGADFLVGVETSDQGLLLGLEEALRAPVWQLFLGRKSFVPSVPVVLPGAGGLREASLESALREEAWPLRPVAWPLPAEGREHSLRLILEAGPADPAAHETRIDQPLAAAFRDRSFGPRRILQPPPIVKEYHGVPQPAHA